MDDKALDAILSKPTHESIWNTLSSIDVSDHIEKKMNLSYLSWAWAWGVLMDNYPSATIDFYHDKESNLPCVFFPDKTAEVRCRVTIGSIQREMWLPVMDNRNNAKVNPNSRDISDAKMRCLVKTLALFGLGHYIYAGEDLPPSDKEETKQVKAKEPEKPTQKEPVKQKTTDWTADPKKYANTFVEPVLALIDKAESIDSLKSLFVQNKSGFEVLEKEVPEQYKKLISTFMAKKESLEKEISNADTK
jgi:hypothetical protein